VGRCDFLARLASARGDLACRLRSARIPGAAAFLRGRPRAARDVGCAVLVEAKDVPRVAESAKPFGFRPRIEDASTFAKEARVLLLRHEPSAIDLDVSLGPLPLESFVDGNPGLDLARVRSAAREPADPLDAPEIASRLEELTRGRQRKILAGAHESPFRPPPHPPPESP
jgi:hypothetical protein